MAISAQGGVGKGRGGRRRAGRGTSQAAPPETGLPPGSADSPPAQDDAIIGAEGRRQLEKTWEDPPGFIGWFKALQNDEISKRLMGTAFGFFLLAGALAVLMRLQLLVPENTFIGPQEYNELFTMHGSTMMFLFVVPMMEGFAIMVLPFLLGNREMVFPRLGAFSWFTLIMGGILFFASYLFDAVPSQGWFAYVPLSGPEFAPGIDMDFWLLALSVAEVAAIAAGVEIIISILCMRAPGMRLSRMPVFAWAMLVTAFMIIFAFTTLLVGSALLELDRKIATQFFNPDLGGSPILWQHLFWIFGHPEVYIQFVPATGMISMIVPVFARRSLVGYPLVVTSMVATGFLSFVLWVHHMFAVGLPQAAMALFSVGSIMVAVPAGVQIFAWLATIWTGRPVWKTPFLFIAGFFATFIIGGITGVMLGSVPFDWQVHDSYFVVAHLHYVLIGGSVMPIFAALYYWIPKFSGKVLSERIGKWNFWLFFIGFHITFFPQHLLGLWGMPRRVYTYPVDFGWGTMNLISTIGSVILATGALLFVYNLFYSLRYGEPAGDNPWGGDSLEWATSSPPPNYGFAALPIVRSRHPLWEQGGVHVGDEPTMKLVNGLARWPLSWRAALVTSVVDAKPKEIFRVASPSIWPFVTAVGLIVVFGSEIFSLRLIALIGILTVILGLVGWHWPDTIPTTDEEEDAFEAEHGVEVRAGGSYTVARWSIGLTLLILYIVFIVLVSTYIYIRIVNPTWPPDNIPMPDLLLPGAAVLVSLLSAGAGWWARRSIKRNQQAGLRLGLGLMFLLSAGTAALLVIYYSGLPFRWDTNAYGSVFWTLGYYAILVMVCGLVLSLFVQVWAWRGRYSARRHVAVNNSVIFGWGAVLMWLLTFGVLFLTPYFGN